ncbi:hypothetical protein M569_13326, partial [Genlisea aurea]
ELDAEVFTEALLLKPLPDGKVLTHFHFQTTAPPTRTHGRHHHVFPKSIYQLVHKFKVREMELSFTQGRWNYERWGGYDPISNANAKPPGVELWAEFDVPHSQIDDSWKNLSHTLSGLFCASINFLDHSASYSAPRWSFPSSSGKLRYGTLPREAVCTENLTPWLKLLPCRDKDGLSSLMDRSAIYKGFYHSQRLHLKSSEFGSHETVKGMVLEQTLTVVLQPNTLPGKVSLPSFSIGSLFGRKVKGKCSLSTSSNVYVLSEFSDHGVLMDEIDHETPVFKLSSRPNRVIRETDSFQQVGSVIYEYTLESSGSEPFDLGLQWKNPVFWSSKKAPFHTSRFLTGSGNERGAIAISMKSNGAVVSEPGGCSLRVGIFQVVPWYVKMYYHTLRVFIDGEAKPFEDNVEKVSVSPSEDKVSPGVMEIALRLPCSVKTAAMTVEFDKGFLHIDEYPPDANQGFDIPSSIVHFAGLASKMNFGGNFSGQVPLLAKLQEETPVRAYTEVLLVPLTTPDFSMPYNVITIACTVFALYFGSLLNALRRRAGEEERLLREKGKKRGLLTWILS